MVHIPFLNIEVPEFRVAQVVPDAFGGCMRLCTRAMDAAQRTINPLPPEIEEVYVEDVVASFPREFQKVFSRGAQGRHKDEDQLSSELEDAAFDYYRRMIRTAAVGATEEDQEDVTAYKLGLDRPSAQEQAWEVYRMDHDIDEGDPLARYSIEGTPEEKAAIDSFAAACEHGVEGADTYALLQAENISSLQKRLKKRPTQAVTSATNAGLGLVLGIAVIKGVGLLVQKISLLRKPKTKSKKTKAAPLRTGAPVTTQKQGQSQSQEKVEAEAAAKARARSSARRR